MLHGFFKICANHQFAILSFFLSCVCSRLWVVKNLQPQFSFPEGMNESRALRFNGIQILSLFRVLGCKQNAPFAHHECDHLGIYSENKFPILWTIEFQCRLEKKHAESLGDFIIIIIIGGFVQNCSSVSLLSAVGNLQSEELHQESSFMFLALKAHNRIFLGSTQQLMK